jgi:hypothetical protein
MTQVIRSSLLVLFCYFMQCSHQTNAQDSTTPAPGVVQQGGLEFVALSRTAQGRAKPGGILVLRAVVRNTSEQSAEGSFVAKITGYAGEEYRRQFTLNAKEERALTLPVRIPNPVDGPSVEIGVTLNVLESGREVMLRRRNDEPASQTLTFPLVLADTLTALTMNDSPPDAVYWSWPPTEKYASYEFAVTTRVEAGKSRMCAMIDEGLFPLNMADWDSIDLLIISNPRAFDDASSVAAMQQFMQNGGRIWIMLDHVETESFRGLFMDGQHCETVDTVELNRFVVDVTPPSPPISVEDRTVDRDQPLRLKRVVQQGGSVTHLVDGWPIAIWYPIGSGELLVTALESEAWILPNAVQQNSDPSYQSDFKLPVWGGRLAGLLHADSEEMPIETSTITYPLELIGNPVVSFGVVGAVLSIFCCSLIAFGMWRFFSAADLKWIGGLAPVLSLAACIPLLFVAMRARHEIPAMITKLQIIRLGEQGTGTLREISAVYNDKSQAMTLQSNSDGLVTTARTMQSGIRKTTIEDFQRWSLSNEDWPPGSWRYETQVTLNHPPIHARAEMTADGLVIAIPQNLPSPLEDTVVNFSLNSKALGKWTSDHQLLIDGQFEAENERWTTSSIVSDEQGRRATVYSQFFDPQKNQQSLPNRTLYGWTNLWPQSPQWNVEVPQKGAALVSIPIELVTPEPGTEVLVPHSLITISASPYAAGMSTAYNMRTGQWAQESTLATNSILNFSLPPEVLPLEATAIHFEWDIKAPKRTARLINIDRFNNKSIEIVALNEPSIPWRATSKDGQLLEDLRDGSIELQIEIADREGLSEAEKQSFISWQIKHLRIAVSGRTLPRDDLAERLATGKHN